MKKNLQLIRLDSTLLRHKDSELIELPGALCFLVNIFRSNYIVYVYSNYNVYVVELFFTIIRLIYSENILMSGNIFYKNIFLRT